MVVAPAVGHVVGRRLHSFAPCAPASAGNSEQSGRVMNSNSSRFLVQEDLGTQVVGNPADTAAGSSADCCCTLADFDGSRSFYIRRSAGSRLLGPPVGSDYPAG